MRRGESVLQTFSPREVQARVRAGESADAIAATTGWDLEKVLRYAEPLMDERAFIARQAASVEVRRSGGGATLAESALTIAGSAGESDIAWDAFRRDDGRWIVTATLPDGEMASWSYDHQGRNVHALDDVARALMGAAPATPTDDVDIVEALDLAAETPAARQQAATAEAPTRPRLVAVPAAVDDGDQTGSVESAGTSAVPHPSTQDLDGAESPAVNYEQETITLPRESDKATSPEAPAADEPKPAAKPRKARGRKGRTSIPSWDEILFGAGKTED